MKKASLINILKQSGVDPNRLKSLIEESVEIECAVLYANRHKIPDEIFLKKELSMVEAKMFCIMLSQPQ